MAGTAGTAGMRAGAAAAPLMRAGRALGERVGRVRLGAVPRPLAVVVLGLWLVWGVIAVVLLLPGAVQPIESAPFTPGNLEAGARRETGFIVIWSLLLGTSAVVSAAGTALLALSPRRAAGLRAAVLAAAVGLVPCLFLLSAMAPLAALVTLLATVATATLAALAGARGRLDDGSGSGPATRTAPGRRGRAGLAAGAAGAALVVWLPLLVDGLTSVVPLSLVSSYAILGSGAVAVTGFVTLGGVASAAESANATAGTLARRTATPLAAGAVIGVMIAVVVLRYTVLNDVFGALESELWSLRDLASWPHAVLLGILIVVFALRSATRPYESRGQRQVTGVITVAAGLSNLVLVGAAVLLFVLLFITGEVVDPTPYLHYLNAAGLVIVLALLPFALRRRYSGSTGRVGAIIGLVYLVPMLCGLVFALRDAGVPAFWASPTQVLAVILAVTAVLFVARLIAVDPRAATSSLRRRIAAIEPAMLVRLAVIPLVAVHAGELLPAVWGDGLARWVVVLLSLLAFLLLSPRPAADPARRARTLLAASALQVAILGTFATSIVLDYDAEIFTVVAVIWLAVPVSAVLCCRAVPAPLVS